MRELYIKAALLIHLLHWAGVCLLCHAWFCQIPYRDAGLSGTLGTGVSKPFGVISSLWFLFG
jgi:hypothetical protein